MKITKTVSPKGAPPVILLPDLIADFVADTEAARAALESSRPRGPVTGLRQVDELLGAYLAPGLHILQGAPGCGKTAFALQTAANCFYPCLYVTAEMPMLELFRRLIARETKTFLGKLKTGEIGGKEAQKLALVTAQNLPQLALMDATRAYATVESICAAADGLRSAQRAEHVLVIIDSLTVWARSAAKGIEAAGLSEYDIINQGVLGCTNIANHLSAPVIALSHRSRAGNSANGGLHAAKGSGSIEYEAETVLDLEPADKQGNGAPDVNGDVRIKLTPYKNRHGIPNIAVPLLFNGRTQTFTEA